MRDYAQWMTELSKEIYVRSDEENSKIFWKINEMYDEDVEEEE